MDFFYDKLADTYRNIATKENGAFKSTYQPIYEKVRCAFRSVRKDTLTEGEGARETDKRKYTVNFMGQYTDVKVGDKLVLFEKTGKQAGEYIVMDVIEYPDLTGRIDNLSLTIKIWNNG